MITKLAARTVGLGLIGLALWAYYTFTLGEYYRYSDEQHQAAPRVVSINHSVSPPMAALEDIPTFSISAFIRLSYNDIMRENEDQSVTIDYEATITRVIDGRPSAPEPLAPPARPISVTLSAANFRIAPPRTIVREGTPFPLRFHWSVSPRGHGTRELLLDLRDLLAFPRRVANMLDSDANFDFFFVDGELANPADWETRAIKVVVNTYLGVSARVAHILMMIVGLLGFVLMHPVFIAWLNTKIQRSPPIRANPGTSRRSE